MTGNYFEVLGVDAVLGRTFRPEEAEVGADPVAVCAARGEPPDSQPFAAKIEVQRCKTAAGEPLGKLRIECCRGDALWHLRQLLAEYAVPFRDDARESFPLLAGGVGYFGYEAGSWSGPGGVLKTADSSQAPDIYFALYDTVLCHDHAKGKTFLSVVGRGKTEREAGQQAASAAAAVEERPLRKAKRPRTAENPAFYGTQQVTDDAAVARQMAASDLQKDFTQGN